jgi:hypothetical protein
MKCGEAHWKDKIARWRTVGNINIGSKNLSLYLCDICKQEIEDIAFGTMFEGLKRIIYSFN